jgi:hypothetical protein
MKRLLLIVAIAVYAPVIQGSQNPSFNVDALTPKGREAYQKLMTAKVFRVGGVGIGGETSEEELALYDLLADKQAIAALRSLVVDGSYEGGLYGLLGLSISNVAEFNRAVDLYKSRQQPPERRKTKQGHVSVQWGCITSGEDWLKVVTSIQSGHYDKLLRKSGV